MNHPFKETSETDLQIKLEDTTLYLNSKLINDITSTNNLARLDSSNTFSSTAKSSIQIEEPSQEHEFQIPVEGDLPISNSVQGNVIIDLSQYNSYDVVEFFKHLNPAQNATITDRNNFKTILALCERFNVIWLKEHVEFLLLQRIEEDYIDNTHLSLYLALAKQFNLETLKEVIEDTLIWNFQTSNCHKNENDAVFTMVSHFNLDRVRELFETHMIELVTGRKNIYSTKDQPPVVTRYCNYLIIAEFYHYNLLKDVLLQTEHCAVNSWMEDKRMENLSNSTLFHIAKHVMSKIFNKYYSISRFFAVSVVKMLNLIYKQRFDQDSEMPQDMLFDQKAPEERQTSSKQCSEEKCSKCGNPCEREISNPFEATESTDVEVQVEELTLHLHSSVLRHCSPVFNIMLSGSFREGLTKKISFPGKDAATVIEFLKFFYPDKNVSLQDSSDLEDLLGLCQEYQVTWLHKKIEEHIVRTFDFKKNITHILTGWQCVEKFPQLHAVKSKVNNTDTSFYYLHNMSNADSIKFVSLEPTTKYLVVRNNIERWMKCKSSMNTTDLESLKSILSFLDGFLLC